jgi:hypothetical protein
MLLSAVLPAGADRRQTMQVAKLRAANDNGLVPAGRYFTRLAHNLRTANSQAAAVVDEYEAQEQELERRCRRRRPMGPVRPGASGEHMLPI